MIVAHPLARSPRTACAAFRPSKSARPAARAWARALPLLAAALSGATGCQQQTSRIAEIRPYVAGSPPAVEPLRPPPQARAEPRRVGGASGHRSWTPPGGISDRWRWIVIHHSDSDRSTPQGMRDWHVRKRGWDELGYHFVIGNGIGYPDGEVFVGNRWTRQMHGAHCKTPDNRYNDHGIGICLIGNLDAHPPTRKQIAALARLVSFLCDECNVPRSNIVTHGGVTHKTRCPGQYFSLSAVLRHISLGPEADSTE